MSNELRSIHQQSQSSVDAATSTGSLLLGQATRIAYGGSATVGSTTKFVISGATDGNLYCLPTDRWSVNTHNTQAHQIWRLATANAVNSSGKPALSEKELSELSETEKEKFAVSAVAYHPETNKAASATRGGFVMIHLNVDNSKTVTTKQLCRMSSVVRSICFSKDGTKLIVTGDSVRVLTLSESKMRALKINVPPPILSASLSPCEKWISLVSVNGDIGVVPFDEEDNNKASLLQSQSQQQPLASQPTQQVPSSSTVVDNNNDDESDKPQPQMFALPKQLPADLRKDENVVPRVHWCQVPSYALKDATTATDEKKQQQQQDAAADNNKKTEIPTQLLLSIPGEGGFKIYTLKVTENHSLSTSVSTSENTSSTSTKKQCYKLVSIGFVALPFDAQQQQQQQNAAATSKSVISSAMLFPMSKHKIQAVVLSSCKDVASGSRVCHLKIDRKFKQPAQEVIAHACPMTITEFAVNPFTGALVFGTATGDVGFLRKFCTVLMHKNAAAIEAEQQQQKQQQEQEEKTEKKSKDDGDAAIEEDDDHDPYLDDTTDTNDDDFSIADGSSSSASSAKSEAEDELLQLLDDAEASSAKKKNKKKDRKKKKDKKHDFSSSSAEESDVEGLVDDLIASAPKYVPSSRRRRVRRNLSDDDDNENEKSSNNKKKKDGQQNISSVLLDSDEEDRAHFARARKMFVEDEAEDGDESESEASSEEGFVRRRSAGAGAGNSNKKNRRHQQGYGALEDDMLDDDDEDEDESDFADDEHGSGFFDDDEDDASPSSFGRHSRRRRGRASDDANLFFSTANPSSLRLMQQQIAMALSNSNNNTSWEESFQIGATEPDEDGMLYHCFNNIGVIRTTNPETSIAFHDKSKSVIRINRPGLVCYGSLGLHGAALLISPDAPPLDSIRLDDDEEYEAELKQEQEQQQQQQSKPTEDGDAPTTQQQDANDSPQTEERKRKEKIRNQRRHAARLEKARKESSSFELYFRAFQGIGNQPDWHMPIQVSTEGSIRSLSVGKRFIALFTDRYLRIFSVSGWERGVVSVPHSVICSVGYNTCKAPQIPRDSFDPLVYVYQEAPGSALSLRVLNVDKEEECLKPVQLPLSMVQYRQNNNNNNNTNNKIAAPLSWLGFSDEGTICCADENGTTFAHTSNWGGSFQPICEPHRAAETATPWVWHVTEDKVFCFKSNGIARATSTSINIFSTLLNNNNTNNSNSTRLRLALSYPPVTIDIPTPEMIPIRVPALGAGILNDTVWALRQYYLRLSAKANDLKRNSEFYTEAIAKLDLQLDQILLRLFEIELKDERVAKAVDLATYFQLTDTLEKATRYAHDHNHAAVCDKLILLLQYRTKNKKKRMCQLPLAGTMVSEKDRDRMLRQLLANQKNQQNATAGQQQDAAQQQQKPTQQQQQVKTNRVPVALQSPSKSESQVVNLGNTQTQQHHQQQGSSPQAAPAPFGVIQSSPVRQQQQQPHQQQQKTQQQQPPIKPTATKFSDMQKQKSAGGGGASSSSTSQQQQQQSKPGNFFNRLSTTKTSTVTSQPSAVVQMATAAHAAATKQQQAQQQQAQAQQQQQPVTPPSPKISAIGAEEENSNIVGAGQQTDTTAGLSNSRSGQKENAAAAEPTGERPSASSATAKQVKFNLPSPSTKQQEQEIDILPTAKPMEAMPSSGRSLDDLVRQQQNQQQSSSSSSAELKNALDGLRKNDDDEEENDEGGEALSFF